MTEDNNYKNPKIAEIFGQNFEEQYAQAKQKNKAWILLEDYIMNLERGPGINETREPVKLEPWMKNAYSKINRNIEKHKTSIRRGATEYGKELEEEGILKEIISIVNLRVAFQDFYSEFNPRFVDTDKLSIILDENTAEIGKVTETRLTKPQNVPLNPEVASDISDLADDSNLSRSSIIRVLMARAIEESEYARDEEREKARQLTNQARDEEKYREPLERMIAEYVGGVVSYLEAELDEEGLDMLEEMESEMTTEWAESVSWILDNLKAGN